jgi:adenine deaminase
MSSRIRAATLAAGVIWAACAAQPAVPADLVLVNGNILTVNRSDEVVEAIAVTNGRISAVGTSQEIRTLVGARTRVIDLHGRTATPGLIDSHVHFSEAGEMFTIDLCTAAALGVTIFSAPSPRRPASPRDAFPGDPRPRCRRPRKRLN